MSKIFCLLGRHRFRRYRFWAPGRVAFAHECTRCGHKELEVRS